jgi:subtilase family serine protease
MRNSRSVYGLALLVAAVTFANGLAGAQPRDRGGTRPVMIAPGSGPDLSVRLGSTVPVWPRNAVNVTVTVKNIGGAPAPKSDCRIIIRQGHAPRQVIRTINKTVRALDPGDKYAFSFPLKVGLGLFEVAATVDRKNKIAESDETNNNDRIMITGK